MIPPFPLGGRYPFYPSYKNASWPNYDDTALIHESVKMTFLVLLLGFILLILFKECGLCKNTCKRLARLCRGPEAAPLVQENGRRPDEDARTMVTVSDVRQQVSAENSAGDFVSRV